MEFRISKLESGDKVIPFKAGDYEIDTELIESHHLGGVALMLYCFLSKYASDYWNEGSVHPVGNYPAGDIYMEANVLDFQAVTGASGQEIWQALQLLNLENEINIVEVQHEWGIRYAYHAR